MGLVFGQSNKDLLVPVQELKQIIPRTINALEMTPEHLSIGGMVVKLGALLRILRDAPERRAHLPARSLFCHGRCG